MYLEHTILRLKKKPNTVQLRVLGEGRVRNNRRGKRIKGKGRIED